MTDTSEFQFSVIDKTSTYWQKVISLAKQHRLSEMYPVSSLSTEISYFKSYETSYKLKISDVKQSLSVDIFSPKSII